MIKQTTLQYLIAQKIKDARALYMQKRYAGAVYIQGYAIELCLKKRICSTFNFTRGFPENQSELMTYISQLKAAGPINAGLQLSFSKVNEIRNHDLGKLLIYSGKQYSINLQFLAEWSEIVNWNPEQRYKRKSIGHAKAYSFMKASRIVIQEIS